MPSCHKWDFSWWVPVYMLVWYLCSGATLFTNKYVLTNLGADADLLGYVQLLSTTAYGSIQFGVPRLWRYYRHRAGPSAPASTTVEQPKYETFYRDMILVGIMRFGTILLSLVSLKSVAASFTQTIKASAPIFTVLIAWLLLGEHSGIYVTMSLVPIMGGLVLVSTTELSFHTVGFVAALLNNILDCIQNVFCKKLISQQKAFTPIELQFYSSVAAVAIQLPLWLILRGSSLWQHRDTSQWMLMCMAFNGLMFHTQSIAAFYVVSVISPVSYSVSNTVKRSLLTFLSILVFHNRVTMASLIGTLIVLSGVFLYNSARTYEQRLKKTKKSTAQSGNEAGV